MSWLNVPHIRPLSTVYTHREVATMLSLRLGDLGKELHVDDLRRFINLAISRTSAFITLHDENAYRVKWDAISDIPDYPPDVNYRTLNLADPYVPAMTDPNLNERQLTESPNLATIIPWSYARTIDDVVWQQTFAADSSYLWKGSSRKLDMKTFQAVAAGLNDQWRQSKVWAQNGNILYLWEGSETYPPSGLSAAGTVELFITRRPLLDNLADIDLPVTAYNDLVDIPDDAIPLLLDYATDDVMTMLAMSNKATGQYQSQSALSEQRYLMSRGVMPQAAPQQG